MKPKVSALVQASLAADPGRRRQSDGADRKSAKNQSRYFVNLVAEAAGENIDEYSACELLEAATLVAGACALKLSSQPRMPSQADYLAALGPCGK